MYLRDNDGFYHFFGRNDDMFKVGGVWVSPLILKSAFAAHEAVAAIAVVGRKDKDEMIKPKAFVVLKDGYPESPDLLRKLRAHVREYLVSSYAQSSSQNFYAYYPRWIEFRSKLPMTATGKIQRYKLREEDVAALA